MDEAGLDRGALRRIDATGSTPTDRLRATADITRLSRRPRAVFCANDLLAVALETVAIREGLSIPEQLAILGYDDVEGADIAPVPLSTIRQPQYDLGAAAAQLVFDPLDDDGRPRKVRFDPQLVVRSSTVRLPDATR
jgi:LacI family transcriptional regulator